MTAQSVLAIRTPDWCRLVLRRVLRRLDPMQADLRSWALSLVACAVLVAICYAAIDRPVARFFQLGDSHDPLIPVLHLLPGQLAVAVVGFGVLVPLFAASRTFRGLSRQLLVAALAYAFAFVAKDTGKFVFGRTWPESWLPHQPSFLRDGVYGFFPFHAGRAYGSFPSGHMCVTMALVIAAWVLWPRLRLLWAVAGCGMGLMLVGLNFHFVSDVIAGAWLGTACGVAAVKLARRLRPAWFLTAG